jgi:complement component 1 Q subcomponent-binding protein
VTLTRQTGKDQITVKFNVSNTVNASEPEQESDLNPAATEGQANNSSTPLKSRPTFTVDISRGSQTLSFLCSYLPNDYPDSRQQPPETGSEQNDFLEDFQIDEFTIHDGEWNETVYSSDCSVIDGELYDKLLNLLEEHGIGEGLFRVTVSL